jgi:hypothetical protein|tara:strand:+ start:488 stop:691 length:204 start_codon:yes stop_codon:yes gene_type:complete
MEYFYKQFETIGNASNVSDYIHRRYNGINSSERVSFNLSTYYRTDGAEVEKLKYIIGPGSQQLHLEV